jgi:pimeloyl-ACP methyl ester carboxylesterase
MDPRPFSLEREGVELAGEELAGEGAGGGAILLLHGLTATRRYVLHGSRHLPRHGLGLVGYDARGHGASGVAPAGSYGYDALADDAAAVIAARMGEGRPVLAGHSMGAHTAVALALRDPGRIAGLVLIGPAALGTPAPDEALAYWDRLADGLEQGGVEGFVAAYDNDLPARWREPVLRITRQRLEAHEHPEGVARALREVPRSLPFEGMSELAFLDLPAMVVASHDDADPSHPYTVAEAWAETLPRARLVSEDPGQSPLPWQGGRLSREIAAFCAEDAVRQRS